jgi:hypothetical protein
LGAGATSFGDSVFLSPHPAAIESEKAKAIESNKRIENSKFEKIGRSVIYPLRNGHMTSRLEVGHNDG